MKNLLTAVALVFSLNAMSQNVYIPNAFTPNGDGNNDTWKPIFDDTLIIEKYTLEVYTRQGEIIFRTNNPSTYWDGNYWGTPVPDTTYAYRLIAVIDKLTHIKEGFLQILK